MTKNKTKQTLIKSAYLKNKLINAGIYMVFLIVLLIVNYFAILGFKGNIWILLDVLLMFFFISPIFFFKNTMFDRIYLAIIMFWVFAFITVNINYYRFFGVVFAIKDLAMAFDNFGQIGDNINNLNWVITSINVVWYGIALAGLLVFNIKFNFKEDSQRKIPSKKTRGILGGVILGASLLSYEFTLGMWSTSERLDGIESIRYVNYNTNYHFRKMGMMSFYLKELRQLVTDRGLSDNDVINYLKEGSYLVNDQYTGLLKEKMPNICVIMIESGDRFMVNQYTTPNLWTLFNGGNSEKPQYKGGVYGEHNYSYNHTNVSNTISITGNYPHKMLNQRKQYNLPFSLPIILKNKGYRSKYYYEVIPSEDGYHDIQFGKSLGFDDVYEHKDLASDLTPWTYKESNFNPDTAIAKRIIKTIEEHKASYPNQPFYVNWMSMVMHLQSKKLSTNKVLIEDLYTRYGAKLKDLESRGLWKNAGQTDDAKERFEIYALKTMDFDEALGYFMNKFYESDDDYYKNTLLIAYGDHIMYEPTNGVIMSSIAKNITDEENINLYSTVLGMYHPSLSAVIDSDTSGLFDGHKLNRTTSPACIVPTILDLLGIKYNPNIYQDKSIFDLNGESNFSDSMNQIYYSLIKNIYMSENYSSADGAHISTTIKDNKKQEEFCKKVKAKQYQLRVLDSIYHKGFFDRYKLEDFLPSSNLNKYSKEVALVKYYLI